MSGIGRRLNRVEAGIAPTVSDEVARQCAAIMADTPPLPRKEPETPEERARIAAWKRLSFPSIPGGPSERIKHAERIAAGRRRLFAFEHGQGALDRWDEQRIAERLTGGDAA